MTVCKKDDRPSHQRFFIARKGVGFRRLTFKKSLKTFIKKYMLVVRFIIS